MALYFNGEKVKGKIAVGGSYAPSGLGNSVIETYFSELPIETPVGGTASVSALFNFIITKTTIKEEE